MLALVFESGVPQSVGIAINWIALALMIISYCLLVVVVLRVLVSSQSVPFAVWPALGVYPLVWGLLVASSPGGPYEITPTVVAGAGAIVAWLTVGRTSGNSAVHVDPTVPAGNEPRERDRRKLGWNRSHVSEGGELDPVGEPLRIAGFSRIPHIEMIARIRDAIGAHGGYILDSPSFE